MNSITYVLVLHFSTHSRELIVQKYMFPSLNGLWHVGGKPTRSPPFHLLCLKKKRCAHMKYLHHSARQPTTTTTTAANLFRRNEKFHPNSRTRLIGISSLAHPPSFILDLELCFSMSGGMPIWMRIFRFILRAVAKQVAWDASGWVDVYTWQCCVVGGGDVRKLFTNWLQWSVPLGSGGSHGNARKTEMERTDVGR